MKPKKIGNTINYLILVQLGAFSIELCFKTLVICVPRPK